MLFDNEPQIKYPLYYKCINQTEWQNLNNAANELLGFANDKAQNYSNPIIDINNKYWFVVNSEVVSLVDLTKCKEYAEIEFK